MTPDIEPAATRREAGRAIKTTTWTAALSSGQAIPKQVVKNANGHGLFKATLSGSTFKWKVTVTATMKTAIKSHLLYVNVHAAKNRPARFAARSASASTLDVRVVRGATGTCRAPHNNHAHEGSDSSSVVQVLACFSLLASAAMKTNGWNWKSGERRGMMIDRQAVTIIKRLHEHDLTTIHFLEQKDGVPYELEQIHCAYCEEVLVEEKRRLVA